MHLLTTRCVEPTSKVAPRPRRQAEGEPVASMAVPHASIGVRDVTRRSRTAGRRPDRWPITATHSDGPRRLPPRSMYH
eukprot:scaffold603_cov404-Prasinococcus_capsulatus_cf.AAC.1